MGAIVPYEDFPALAGKILSESVQEAQGAEQADVPVLWSSYGARAVHRADRCSTACRAR